MKTKLHFVLSLSFFLTVFSVTAQQSYWQKTEKNQLRTNDNATTLNSKFYQTYQLDIDSFKAKLVNAPLRSASTSASNITIYLPNVKGELEPFSVVETRLLSKELTELHPNIKTYLGFSKKTPGVRARFSVTPQGLQSMVTYPGDDMNFLVPQSKTDSTSYIVYSRAAREEGYKDFECLTEDFAVKKKGTTNSNRDANDQLLRTFRIAISTTAEYTNFWDDGNAANGNAQEDALTQVVSTLNRLNEVFEVDMAVSFTLVTGTEIIYESSFLDPYTGSYNSELQSTLTSVIGEENYDIGHLFAYDNNNGNAGCIGCVCVDGSKGSGFSAHEFTDNNGGPYMTDFFDIDYVPHEMGHQMGANHTFSNSSEGTGVNAEPGSGTTIMGYAGITGSNDVQDHSDPYFHYYSIAQILNNLESRTCWVGTTIVNNAPIADAGSDYTIPMGTAFVLKGDATDTDTDDVLTYTWEQIDDGVSSFSNFGPNKTSGAVWRSRPPSTSKDRYMPIIERVVSGELTESNPVETTDNTSWETVSNVARSLNFALTVRDRSEGNGVGLTPQSDFDTMLVNVDGAAGPFVVTSQSANETWDTESSQVVTWDVAGTDTGSVNTSTVNILLSTDGGYTYPYVLVSAVPNDGEQIITVPIINGGSSTVRVKVEANDNIFYAINSRNFSIQEAEFVLNYEENSVEVCSPDDAVFNFTYNTISGFSATTTFSAQGLPTGASVLFSPSVANTDDTMVTVNLSGTESLAAGNYAFTIEATSGSIIKTIDLEFDVFTSSFSPLNLLTPTNGSADVFAGSAVFTWEADVNATSYEIDIATDSEFTDVIVNSVIDSPTYAISTLSLMTSYFWRVRGVNECAFGDFSVSNFTTSSVDCALYSSLDTPINISAAGNVTYTSILNIAEEGVITDVAVLINISHTYTNDLDISLTSPSGTVIELSSDNGGNGDNYTNTIFDSEASASIVNASAPFTASFLPEDDLSLLYGEPSAGNWVLTVVDDAAQDGGSIEEFTLDLCLEPTLSVDEVALDSDLTIYPNPNNGSFNILIGNPQSTKIKIAVYDINGRRIFEEQFNANQSFDEKIDLNQVQSGVYLIKITDGLSESIKKIVVN
ncbi:zinc-dependent metalloprotease [Winogradskyella wichelsiae]|uniref:zinc-dependent metalloprotease n=1 Tax=Winogradskyella wichelsiae TaxID=2697007 RepID=UPI003EF313C0